MRGFLSLDPDPAALARLIEVQNRLRDALTRQGVHFTEPDRLAPVLLNWPFATLEELEDAGSAVEGLAVPRPELLGLQGRPNEDRPGEIGFAVTGLEEIQAELTRRLKTILDPDEPKPPFIRLARISPPSRKVGAHFRETGLLNLAGPTFLPANLTIWRQNAQGFEPCRTMALEYGGS